MGKKRGKIKGTGNTRTEKEVILFDNNKNILR